MQGSYAGECPGGKRVETITCYIKKSDRGFVGTAGRNKTKHEATIEGMTDRLLKISESRTNN